MSSRNESHESPNSSNKSAATAKITVKATKEEKFANESPDSRLVLLTINEVFEGDLDGTSLVHALKCRQDETSAYIVSMQLFQGRLGGRRGTFMLQGAEFVQGGVIEATWVVVPGSGTDELSNLRGDGGFRGHFGEGSTATLHYWFEQ